MIDIKAASELVIIIRRWAISVKLHLRDKRTTEVNFRSRISRVAKMQTSQFQRKKIAQKIALKQLLMLHVKRLDVRTAATVVSC